MLCIPASIFLCNRELQGIALFAISRSSCPVAATGQRNGTRDFFLALLSEDLPKSPLGPDSLDGFILVAFQHRSQAPELTLKHQAKKIAGVIALGEGRGLRAWRRP